jgi:pimeloyl-ACP methyl ester carboxylesterase
MVADGRHEEIIRRDHTVAMQRAIPGAKLYFIDQGSHFAMWQQPEEFNRELLKFLGSP